MTDTPESEHHLSPAQLARVEALKASRTVQHRSEGLAKAGGPDALDLVAVARWIMTGEDPWPSTTQEESDR